MAIKVNQSPDDPTLPTTVRDDIIHSSQSHNSYKRDAISIISIVIVMAVIVISAIVMVGGVVGDSYSYDDDFDPLISHHDFNLTKLYNESLKDDVAIAGSSEDVR
mmetsp:Transcript_35708/g.65460  ORF Transcript_35708/g.65460 Transcript_35708/m.65460 type:complete len:105 (-) Transcript_35708:347-661(-)